MLACYRENLARKQHLECIIPELEKELVRMNREIVDDEVHITQVFSDMPRGGNTSDPTAKVAMLLASGYKPERFSDMENEIAERKAELESKRITVILVQAWLEGLNPREKFVIIRKMIDGALWRNVQTDFQIEFGEYYSKDGLKRVTKRALAKIYAIAG